MENYLSIGNTKKPFGVKGELKVEVKDDFLEDFFNADVVFIKIKGKPVPFFVETIKDGGSLLLKLEDIDTKESASEIGGSDLLLRSQDIRLHTQETIAPQEISSFDQLVGFVIIDEIVGRIGTIEEVVEYPQQELAVVQYKGREVMIPLHEQLIESIDPKGRVIKMTLPEGLLDV